MAAKSNESSRDPYKYPRFETDIDFRSKVKPKVQFCSFFLKPI